MPGVEISRATFDMKETKVYYLAAVIFGCRHIEKLSGSLQASH
jgi:hypothetical protein